MAPDDDELLDADTPEDEDDEDCGMRWDDRDADAAGQPCYGEI